MSNLSVKDVPEQWAESLRQRAARNHRSLQGELMSIIEAAVLEGTPQSGSAQFPGDSIAKTMQSTTYPRGNLVGFDRFGHPIIRQGWKSVEQVAADLNAIYPQPVPGQPLAVDIIRAERDAR